MKTLSKVMVAMLAILMLAPMNAEASKKEKKKGLFASMMNM